MLSRCAVVCLLLLTLAGCGDDEPRLQVSASRSSEPPGATATPASPEPAPSQAGPSDDGSAPTAPATAAPAPASAAPASPAPGRAGTAAPPPAAPDDPLSPRPALESAAPAGQPACAAAQLTVVDADTLVLPDDVHEVFVLRTDGRACQLQGYPTVRLLDPAGAPLRVAVGHGGHGLPTAAPAVVTLSPTTSLSFVVATGRDGRCADAGAVEVTLPGTSTALRATTSLSVCDAKAGVSPVQRRADDE